MTPQLIDELVAALHANPRIPLEIDLWDAKLAAAYLKVSTRQVAERYAFLPDWPEAVELPSPSKKIRRWKAKDVIKWAEGHRERRK